MRAPFAILILAIASLAALSALACRAASLPLFTTPTPTTSATATPTLTPTATPSPSITPSSTPQPTLTPSPTLNPASLILQLSDLPAGARERSDENPKGKENEYLAEFSYYYPFANQQINGLVDLLPNQDRMEDLDLVTEFFMIYFEREFGKQNIIEKQPIAGLEGIGDHASGLQTIFYNPDREKYTLQLIIFREESLLCILFSLSPQGKAPPADPLELAKIWSSRLQIIAPLYFPQISG